MFSFFPPFTQQSLVTKVQVMEQRKKESPLKMKQGDKEEALMKLLLHLCVNNFTNCCSC